MLTLLLVGKGKVGVVGETVVLIWVLAVVNVVVVAVVVIVVVAVVVVTGVVFIVVTRVDFVVGIVVGILVVNFVIVVVELAGVLVVVEGARVVHTWRLQLSSELGSTSRSQCLLPIQATLRYCTPPPQLLVHCKYKVQNR